MEKQPHHHSTFVLGRDRLARAVTLLLVRNGMSHKDLEQFAAWALGDTEGTVWLQKSQVSSLRNGKLPKPGAQVLVALAAANRALAELAAGDSQDRPPLPRNLRKVEPSGDHMPWWLVSPRTGQPLSPGEWFELLIGAFTTDELGDGEAPYSDETAGINSEQFGLLVGDWMNRKRIRLAELRPRLEGMYPESSPGRRDRLWLVATGQHRWSGAELAEERDALRFCLGRLQGRDALTVRELDRWLRTGA